MLSRKKKRDKENKSKRRLSKIWLSFVAFVFASMFLTAMVMVPTILLFVRRNLITFNLNKPTLTFVIFLFSSVIVSTAITFLLTRKIMSPITEISNAVKEISEGNFRVHIDEGHKIKELRELSEDFNKMVAELNSTETLSKDFLMNVSHEFKTPIASIEGFASLLSDSRLTEEERETYSLMLKDSTSRLSSLIENILALSRLECCEIITEKKEFRLDEQIRMIILELEPIWSSKNITLNINLEEVLYFGNESFFYQIWINLIGNALKFTPENGEVGIQLFSAGSVITVTVTDTGIGIEKQDIPHIFTKFYRAKNARGFRGNGLGLPLVKRILDLCEGNISVNSSVGNGSCFIVELKNNIHREGLK